MTTPSYAGQTIKPDVYDLMKKITIEEAKARLRPSWEPPWDDLDPAILPIVKLLWEEGIETYESCQGGKGHVYAYATVRFHGGISEGFRGLSIDLTYGLNVRSLSRVYDILDKECHGPHWEMTFHIPGCPDWSDTTD